MFTSDSGSEFQGLNTRIEKKFNNISLIFSCIRSPSGDGFCLLAILKIIVIFTIHQRLIIHKHLSNNLFIALTQESGDLIILV